MRDAVRAMVAQDRTNRFIVSEGGICNWYPWLKKYETDRKHFIVTAFCFVRNKRDLGRLAADHWRLLWYIWVMCVILFRHHQNNGFIGDFVFLLCGHQ